MGVQIYTDAAVASAALFRQAMAAGYGSKSDTIALWGRVRYNGSAWEIHASTDSAALVSANLSFVTDHLEITLSNFAVAPVAVATPLLGDSIYWCKIQGVSATKVHIAWYNASSPGTRVTTPDTNMDCTVHIMGA